MASQNRKHKEYLFQQMRAEPSNFFLQVLNLLLLGLFTSLEKLNVGFVVIF
jgi:hypothetical protein